MYSEFLYAASYAKKYDYGLYNFMNEIRVWTTNYSSLYYS